MNRLTSLPVFLAIVLAVVFISSQFVGGQWYQSMNQPAWNPPAIVMAIAWAVLYVLMAVSAWLVWENRRGPVLAALSWWALQLVLGVVWSWFYFGLERIGWAMAVMSLWVIAALIVVNVFRSEKTLASVLMLPLVAWLVFSWMLNFTQWSLNGGGIG